MDGQIIQILGFMLVVAACTANDSLQTLGTFLVSNRGRTPVHLQVTWICLATTLILIVGWFRYVTRRIHSLLSDSSIDRGCSHMLGSTNRNFHLGLGCFFSSTNICTYYNINCRWSVCINYFCNRLWIGIMDARAPLYSKYSGLQSTSTTMVDSSMV